MDVDDCADTADCSSFMPIVMPPPREEELLVRALRGFFARFQAPSTEFLSSSNSSVSLDSRPTPTPPG